MPGIAKGIHVEKLISKQIRHWTVRERLRELGRRPVSDYWSCGYVTVSRKAGSKGAQVAVEVAKRLGWQVFGRELVEYIATTANVRHGVVESFDEKRQSEIRSWIQTIIDRHALGHDKYLRHLLQVLLTIAEHGQAVIIGRGAHLVLPHERGVRVWITAPLEERIETLKQEHGLSRSEAKKMIAGRDAQRSQWIRSMFNADADNPACFDLIINTATWKPAHAAELIIRALEVRFGTPNPAPAEIAEPNLAALAGE